SMRSLSDDVLRALVTDLGVDAEHGSRFVAAQRTCALRWLAVLWKQRERRAEEVHVRLERARTLQAAPFVCADRPDRSGEGVSSGRQEPGAWLLSIARVVRVCSRSSSLSTRSTRHTCAGRSNGVRSLSTWVWWEWARSGPVRVHSPADGG